MGGPQALRQPAQHVMVRACLAHRLDHGAGDLQMGVSAGDVEIVMLQKCRRGQNDVGHFRRFRHELLMHTHEQIIAHESRTDLAQVRRNIHRVGILDKQSGHRRPVTQIARVARQDRTDP